MTDPNREPTPNEHLEQIFTHMPDGQMLQIHPEGFRIYEYIETGETTMRRIQMGETEYVLRVPVTEPIVQREGKHLKELLVLTDEDDEELPDAEVMLQIDTEAYRLWRESLLSPADIKNAATKIIQEREFDSETELVACVECGGEPCSETVCTCTLGGTNLLDLTDDTEVSLREKGEADPDCNTCEGTGKMLTECSCCDGTGSLMRYPKIKLCNGQTGEERILRLDIAGLIYRGELDVVWKGYEKTYTADYQAADLQITFDFAGYIDRQLVDMGIDKSNAAIASEDDSVSYIGADYPHSYGWRAWWQKQDEAVHTGFGRGHQNMTASDVLLEAQQAITKSHGYKQKDAEGVCTWNIQPMRPFADTLEDLKATLFDAGQTVGFSFTAAGERGYSFVALDPHGRSIRYLSTDEHSLREALENAWVSSQKM